MTSAYDRNKKPATDEHTRREGSLREEELGEKGERHSLPDVEPSCLTRRDARGRATTFGTVPLVEEKPGVCSTGKGEEVVCSNGEPVFVDEITGKPVALNVLLKSL